MQLQLIGKISGVRGKGQLSRLSLVEMMKDERDTNNYYSFQ